MTRTLQRTALAALVLSSSLALSGCGYNEFQQLDEQVGASWSEVLSQYQRRADLIPNIVNTVKGEANFEQETLTKVAEKTGGKYFRADSSETLRRIFAEIDRLEKTTIEVKKFQRYRELAHWLIAAGLGLLVAELVLANTLWRKLP